MVELGFASRFPDVLAGGLEVSAEALAGPGGTARALQALADFDAYSAALRAVLVDRLAAEIAEEPLEGRHGQPTRLSGNIAHAVAVSELAALQGTSEHTAARALNFSTALVNTHPAVHEALASGDITEAHARALVDQAATLPQHAAEPYALEALARVRTRQGRLRTPGEFRALARDLRERLHPGSMAHRRAAAREDRRVWLQPEGDGMCTLSALLPAETATGMYERTDALARAARRADGEARTLAQLRADALAHAVLGARERTAAAPSAAVPFPEELLAEVKAEIVVHIPLAVALGASDAPAILDGHGAIDPATARALAAAAPTWQRLFTDAEGTPLALGRTAYRPPAGLRRFLQYRDGACRVPGCTRPAQNTEADHTTEWQDGGTTDAANLALLCPQHHALKSLALHHLTHDRTTEDTDGTDGTGTPAPALIWTTLLGQALPAEPLDRDHVLAPRATDHPPRGPSGKPATRGEPPGTPAHGADVAVREESPPPF
ncbi:HNH endonuclease signature motif containing protein [Sinomonas atrocyanea]|uniref:HNH endonuclease signature motif containing protein n=2 Tax=Sinomonas atrocyanea TaxID=37927 RepID=UPI001C54FA81|nr:HNH endonuclease signature motif containing protein [Sinomonas atrocyanea]